MSNPMVTVGILGFSAVERANVAAALRIKSPRAYRFQLYQLNEFTGADLLIIDAASGRAAEACQIYQRRHPLPDHIVTVGISHRQQAYRELPRPLSIGRGSARRSHVGG